MNSSRQTTIGIVLILILFFGWMIFNQPKSKPKSASTTPTPAAMQDSLAKTGVAPTAAATPTVAQIAPVGSSVVKADSAAPLVIKKIETPLVNAEISSKGGSISSWILKNFKTWDKKPLNLVDQSANGKAGDVQLRFVAADSKAVSTSELTFHIQDDKEVVLKESDTLHINLVAQIDSFASIEKTITVTGSGYLVGVEYHLKGMQSKLTGYRYSLQTTNELPYAEEFPDAESQVTRAFVVLPGDKEEIDVSKPTEPIRKTFNGEVSYLASRTKYFLQTLIPISPRPVTTEVYGVAKPVGAEHHTEAYTLTVQIPIANANDDTLSAKYYLGPLEYSRLSAMQPELVQTMDFGWTFLVRPISIYLLYPIFMFLHSFIANWGLVIIVFSIIAKLLTYPLSIGQMKSMRKMQAIAPEINRMKEEHKGDAKKIQEETFKIYRAHGVNPAGGCLPLLLQMPILFALYAVLQNVIELRQAPFTLWIHDLSVPDRLFDFGATNIPLLGNHISGLTILMTATMIIQQIFTVTDERQKKMAYIMPLVFMFLFNNLPSGVALYYFMFNIFGILQQVYNKKFLPPLSLESMRESAKDKKGFMSKMQDMEKNARASRQQQMTGGKAPLPPPRKKKK